LYPEQNSWRLKSTGLAFSTNEITWPSLEFEALLGKQNKIWLQQLDLALLNDLAELTNFTDLTPFLARQPSGEIKNAYLDFADAKKWQLWFEADEISWKEKNAVPAAQSLR
ncbi:hypothetical protein, partial [Pseudoalteromonas sp. 41-MNA-CIBAN-0057]|uniref:YhdP family protein n=1 Tax=Pseudoalteromonas sp. 41-MNA-CIBAN-0057 TaxID=3140419 RepID=UPI00332E56DF